MADEQPISSGNLAEDRNKVKDAFNTAVGKPEGLNVEMAEFIGVMMVSLTLAVVLLLGMKTITRKAKRDEDEDTGNGVFKAILLVVVAFVATLAYIAITTAR